MTLAQLQGHLDLTKSTAYRLATALVGRGLLVRADQVYGLGPKWLQLAALAPDKAA
jgi:DNA-binding IclR family transcriptional regulator